MFVYKACLWEEKNIHHVFCFCLFLIFLIFHFESKSDDTQRWESLLLIVTKGVYLLLPWWWSPSASGLHHPDSVALQQWISAKCFSFFSFDCNAKTTSGALEPVLLVSSSHDSGPKKRDMTFISFCLLVFVT